MSFLVGALGGGKSQAQQQTAAAGINAQTSVQGKPIPLVYGTTRIAPNYIWYGDFRAVQQASSSGGGKGGVGGGGGGKGGGGSTTYQYYTSFIASLCEGQINGVGEAFVDKNITSLSSLGLSLFKGAQGQAPWGYMTTNHPQQARGYSEIAYIAAAGYSLGTSPQLPNHNFEVEGLYSITAIQAITDTKVIPTTTNPGAFPGVVKVNFASSWVSTVSVTDSLGNPFTPVTSSPGSLQYVDNHDGQYTFDVRPGGQAGVTVLITYNALISGDADPSLVVLDLLTDSIHGVGFPFDRVGDLSYYKEYVNAAGLLISPAYTSQTQTSSMIDDIAKATNSAVVWSNGQLFLVPYGDEEINANGYDYIPPSSPLYSLTDDDFLPNQNATGSSSSSNNDPVLLTRKRQSDQLNSIKLEYLDRSNSYNPAIIEAKDQAGINQFGLRQDSSRSFHMFCNGNAARLSVQLMLQREAIRNVYQFTLDQRYVVLDPMDIVAISDSNLGLVNQWVRILEITENDDLSLSVTAEEYLQGTGSTPLYSFQAGQGFEANYNADPGNANAPVVFEPTAELSEALEVWLGVSGDPLWGGCDVFISNDGTTYKNAGRITGSCRTGLLTASLATASPAPTGQTIDTTSTLSLDLSQSDGQLQSGSQSDANSLATLCFVDGEYIAYETATLVSGNQYDLTYLVRGAYDSPINAHASGKQFLRLDSSIFKFPYTQDFIGSTIYIKLVGFNIYGGGQQNISDVQPYAYTLLGTALSSPLPNIANLRTSYVANITQLAWDEVEDFRPVLYEIRQGSVWQGAQVLGRVAYPPFNVQGNGTYWVAAYSQPAAGLQVYSLAPQSITVSGAQIVSNVIASWDESATGWTGSMGGSAGLSGGNVITAGSGNILTDPDYLNTPNILFYGGTGNGTYTIPTSHTVNIGRVAPCSVIISWTAVGQHYTDNILQVSDYLNQQDILDYSASANIDVYPEIALSQDGSTWGPWQKYSAGSYGAMAYKARMQLQTSDPTVEAILSGFVFAVDVPDRDDHYVNQAIAGGGTTITFTPDGSGTPAAFNGGPQGSPTMPHVQVTILSAQAGDLVVVSNVSLAHCTVQILNGGVGVARNCNVLAQGY